MRCGSCSPSYHTSSLPGMMFSHIYQAWEKAIALAAQGVVQTEPLITDVLPLSEWETGFCHFAERKAIKVLFEPACSTVT